MPSLADPITPISAAISRIRASALFALAFALVVGHACAQRYEQGLLWRIEGAGVAASHVFGTIHLEDPRAVNLPPVVARTLADSRSLMIELGLDPSNLLALAGRMLIQDGRDLPGIAGAELFARAAALTARLGLPEPALRLFKPWAAAVLLLVPQQNPENALDYVLARTAAAQGKIIHELETLDEQLAVFEGMAETEQVALLRQAVNNHERMPGLVKRILEAYLARDLAAMQRISEEGGGDAEGRRFQVAFSRRLLEARNPRMAERMLAQLKEGNAFIAVGALHLFGSDGVLALLEKRGFRVTRVY